MEKKTKFLPWIVTCIGLAVAAEVAAQPTPTLKRLEGAWVPDGARCKDVFFRQGTSINFVRAGAATRDGILVTGTRIRDPKNACTISKTREDGESQTLLLTCFSGLLVSKISFSIRFQDEDTVVRTFSDFPDGPSRHLRSFAVWTDRDPFVVADRLWSRTTSTLTRRNYASQTRPGLVHSCWISVTVGPLKSGRDASFQPLP